jgi:hypothetical protein
VKAREYTVEKLDAPAHDENMTAQALCRHVEGRIRSCKEFAAF